MLHIAADVVNMDKAVNDGAEGEGILSRKPGSGIWTASGVYGHPTLASADRDKLVIDALVDCALREIPPLIETWRMEYSSLQPYKLADNTGRAIASPLNWQSKPCLQDSSLRRSYEPGRLPGHSK